MYHSDGTPLTSDQIFTQLEKIWNSSLQTNKEPVGILTSNHRNSWAKAYNTLIKGAPGGHGEGREAHIPASAHTRPWAATFLNESSQLRLGVVGSISQMRILGSVGLI